MACRKSNATIRLDGLTEYLDNFRIMDERKNSTYEIRVRAVKAVLRGRSDVGCGRCLWDESVDSESLG